MSRHITRQTAECRGEIVAPPSLKRRVDRSFGLHPALHIMTFAGFAVWLLIMGVTFADPELAIPFAVFFVFLAAAFVVVASWARIEGRTGPFVSWSEFRREGFDCLTGHLSAGETMAQVLIMPAMLIIWGFAVAIIHALV